MQARLSTLHAVQSTSYKMITVVTIASRMIDTSMIMVVTVVIECQHLSPQDASMFTVVTLVQSASQQQHRCGLAMIFCPLSIPLQLAVLLYTW